MTHDESKIKIEKREFFERNPIYNSLCGWKNSSHVMVFWMTREMLVFELEEKKKPMKK